MINQNIDSIIYQSYSKLIEYGEKYSETRKIKKREDYMNKAITLRYYLRALRFRDYLTDLQVNSILDCLVQIAGIQNYPVTPNLPTVTPPTVGNTIIIEGPPGPRGEDGGGTDFSEENVSFDTTVDEFDISDAYAARWDYIINGTAQRAGTVIGTWTEDGSNVDWTDTSTPDINGNTDGVEFNVAITGSNVQLIAIVTTGTWNISGSRYFIPNNGSGVGPITNQLSSGKIYIGNVSNVATEQSVTGDISINNSGLVAISSGVIVDGDINPTAGITLTKLAPLTANRGVVSNSSGFLISSSATDTEVGYLSGVTSNIQTQLDSKLGAANGAISTVITVDLTPSRAVISNPAGKIAVSSVTSTELGYLSGVTSSVQTQLNSITNNNSVKGDDGINFRIKRIQIGTWDMNTDDSKSVSFASLGITDILKIHNISATIINDSQTSAWMLNGSNNANTGPQGTIGGWTTLSVGLYRLNGGFFDTSNFSSTGISRGYITILYEV
jgi:hypothetical protein